MFTSYYILLQNCSLGIVGKDMEFTIYDDEDVKKYVSFPNNPDTLVP